MASHVTSESAISSSRNKPSIEDVALPGRWPSEGVTGVLFPFPQKLITLGKSLLRVTSVLEHCATAIRGMQTKLTTLSLLSYGILKIKLRQFLLRRKKTKRLELWCVTAGWLVEISYGFGLGLGYEPEVA